MQGRQVPFRNYPFASAASGSGSPVHPMPVYTSPDLAAKILPALFEQLEALPREAATAHAEPFSLKC